MFFQKSLGFIASLLTIFMKVFRGVLLYTPYPLHYPQVSAIKFYERWKTGFTGERSFSWCRKFKNLLETSFSRKLSSFRIFTSNSKILIWKTKKKKEAWQMCVGVCVWVKEKERQRKRRDRDWDSDRDRDREGRQREVIWNFKYDNLKWIEFEKKTSKHRFWKFTISQFDLISKLTNWKMHLDKWNQILDFHSQNQYFH